MGWRTRCRIQLDLHSKVLGLEYFAGMYMWVAVPNQSLRYNDIRFFFRINEPLDPAFNYCNIIMAIHPT